VRYLSFSYSRCHSSGLGKIRFADVDVDIVRMRLSSSQAAPAAFVFTPSRPEWRLSFAPS